MKIVIGVDVGVTTNNNKVGTRRFRIVKLVQY